MSLTVLGIGNILMRDEGVGVHLMEAVRDGREWPQGIEFIDGGVGGLGLMLVLERSERMIVFDAADMNQPPGTSRLLDLDDIEDQQTDGMIGLHDMPFIQTVRLCEQFMHAPREVAIFAIQPARIEYGRELSPEILGRWGSLVQEAAGAVQKMEAKP